MSKLSAALVAVVVVIGGAGTPLSGQEPAQNRFEPNVRAYEAADKTSPAPRGAILLVGDSQFYRWRTLAEDLPGYTVVNRGIDSFQTSDLLHFTDRLVLPYVPRLIVTHVGGNDVNNGKSPEQILADVQAFVARVRTALRDVPIAFSGITPGPGRWQQADIRKRTNAVVKAWVETQANMHFIDLWDVMLTPDGQPREDLWVEDRIHPNQAGYRIRVQVMTPILGPPDVGRGRAPQGPLPTHAGIDYAPPEPADSLGHKLDLYIPSNVTGPMPLVIWTGGSAWLAENGRNSAGGVAVQLNPAGYAVAGVSIRSSRNVRFPGQVHDIKAAIRWLRANAATYNVDPNRIAIMGDSSGGWTTAMAALTGDVPELEGTVGTTGVPSTVRAAVAFYPPTNFLDMDRWMLQPCATGTFCHDAADSPESQLIGCAIQGCADRVRAADPARYISAADPPLMILHGGSDPLVPHHQGEQLYMALNKACHESVFISLPTAGHGPWNAFLTNDATRAAATIRTTSADGCRVVNPTPFTPTWQTVIDFLERAMR